MPVEKKQISSRTPYLVRAIREWAVDNNLTPQLLIDTTFEGVDVPSKSIKDNKIVLNVDPGAVHNFNIEEEFISFSARFSGEARSVIIPIQSVLAVFDRENQQGIFFASMSADDQPPRDKEKMVTGKEKPHLSLVD